MLSTRQQLACKPLQLMAGRLIGQDVATGLLPCRNMSPAERRIRSKWRRCLRLEDFEDAIHSFDDHCNVEEILDLYRTTQLAPRFLKRDDVIEMMPYKNLGRKKRLKYLATKENELMCNQHEMYHHHRHFNKKIPNLGCVYDGSGRPLYGMYCNTIFAVTVTRKNRRLDNNLIHASLFGQRLVIDFSYDYLMQAKQFASLSAQVSYIHSYNCRAKEPFDLVFSSYSPNSYFDKYFRQMSNAAPENMLITVEKRALEELFIADEVIYLSPHSPHVMEQFDPDAVYVIGGLVDTHRTDRTETSFKRATRGKFRSVRLPVIVKERNDQAPCLALNSVAYMLIDMNNEGIGVEDAMNRHLSVKKMRPPIQRQMLERRNKRRMEDSSDYDEATENIYRNVLNSFG